MNDEIKVRDFSAVGLTTTQYPQRWHGSCLDGCGLHLVMLAIAEYELLPESALFPPCLFHGLQPAHTARFTTTSTKLPMPSVRVA